MESLYRKYRPLTFESVVGQRHIVSTLEHAVTEGRLSHAYLFCGPRGTGKTTMARILAKSLLCQGAEAARAGGAVGCMPDGCCPECEAIAEGTHPDVYELDAASRTGVDNVREEIISSVNFAPVRGAYKVYIIDEVHMLTPAAFNALLKTLEEPPSHVVFVLCTTDPQKILETILSRCQRFDFHRISNEDIVGRLRFICEEEGFEFDDEALDIVARHARGGMRDALSTLEQLSVFGAGAVRADDARALLGEVASSVLAEFSCKIAVRDVAGLFELVRDQVEGGNDLLELTHDLVGRMRDVYTAAVAGPKPELFDGTPEEVAAYMEEARLFESADRLARALTVLDDAALEMRNASDARLVLEVALTRLARPESDLTLEALAERLARLEAQIAAGVPSAPMGMRPIGAPVKEPAGANEPAVSRSAGTPRVAAPRTSAQPEAAPAPMEEPAGAKEPAGTSPIGAPANREPAAAAPAAHASASAQATAVSVPADSQPAMASCAITPPAADAGDLQRRWADAVKRVTASQPSRGALLQSSRAVQDDGETLTIAFPKGSSFALKMISRPDSHEVVMPIICSVFGKRSVSYVMDGAPAPAPAEAPAAAPAPGPAPTSRVGAAPWDAKRPAPAAAPATSPSAAAAPSQMPATPAPEVDQASGPTVLPEPDIEADRRAWEDESVPYDDDMIAAYEGSEEVPPFVAPPAEEVPVAAPAPAPEPAAPEPAAPAAAPDTPFGHVVPIDDAPQTPEETKAMLEGIFGGVVIKPVDE